MAQDDDDVAALARAAADDAAYTRDLVEHRIVPWVDRVSARQQLGRVTDTEQSAQIRDHEVRMLALEVAAGKHADRAADKAALAKWLTVGQAIGWILAGIWQGCGHG